MKKDTYYFKSADKQRIGYSKWDVEYPISIVHIIHAFAEDTTKYEDFIHFLNKIGITVYALDLRGHGNTQLMKKKQTPIDKERYMKILGDIHKMNQIIKQEHPRVPITLFGHASASSVVRAYATMKSDFNKMIITGIVHPTIGEMRKEKLLRLFTSQEKLMQHGNEDHLFSKEDWMDSENLVKTFINPINLSKQSQQMKVLILSGANDPVEKNGLYPLRALAAYQDQMIDATLINYEASRHGVLFGPERSKVVMDIKKFIEK